MTLDWKHSSDPVAMLSWLAELHPPNHEQACFALGLALESIAPLASLVRQQRDWMDGRRLNGPAVFSFAAIARRVVMAIRAVQRDSPQSPTSVEALTREIAGAVRRVVPDPEAYRISDPVDASDRDPGAPRLAPGTRVVLPSGVIRLVRGATFGPARGWWLYEIEGELAALRPASQLTLA